MGIGVKQMYEDLGIEMKIKIFMDATAGISMLRRQGLGTVKHVATQYLWTQELIQNKEVVLQKVITTENFADLMTKPLSEMPTNYFLRRMGFVVPTAA